LTGNAFALAAEGYCRSNAFHMERASQPSSMRGRLVIAADSGGLAEVLGDTGLKFPPGNAVSLVNCSRRVIENPALIDAYGERARNRALQVFQRSEMLAGNARIYRGGH
jgi:glycosyltransferase involved in cell wall biosynthesis